MRFGEVIAVDRNVGEAIAFCKDLDLRRRSHLTNFFRVGAIAFHIFRVYDKAIASYKFFLPVNNSLIDYPVKR